MQIVSAREFRANQGKFLTAAMNGQSIVLSSRYGNFKIMPIDEDDTLVSRIGEGLREMRLIEEGKLPSKSARAFLDEL